MLTEPDGGKRVQFKAENGTILGGTDVLVRPPAPVGEPPKWAAGATRYFREKTYGLWLERKVGPFVVAAEIKQSRADFGSGATATDAALRVGFQF